VAEVTASRWWELDRPPMLRTTHAVVITEKPEDDARAKAIAERVAGAVATAKSPADFRRAAESVPAEGLTIRVEDLKPVTRDGRALDLGAPLPPGTEADHYAAAFVDAAFAIAAPGKVSPVVRTSFGYHVILAVEWIPERRIPLEERRALLQKEILSRRATLRMEAVLAQGRERDRVEVERASNDLMERVPISR